MTWKQENMYIVLIYINNVKNNFQNLEKDFFF